MNKRKKTFLITIAIINYILCAAVQLIAITLHKKGIISHNAEMSWSFLSAIFLVFTDISILQILPEKLVIVKLFFRLHAIGGIVANIVYWFYRLITLI